MNNVQNTEIDDLRSLFERTWEGMLASRYQTESPVSQVIHYVLSGEGKRVRPLLCLLSAKAVGGDATGAVRAAMAVEMVHAYSLVHDDLPCMDDDSMRRGRPTAHVAFDEARALLAGDAILTDAFQLLSDDDFLGISLPADHHAAPTRLRLVGELARAAGGRGMVHGQAMDMFWTDRSDDYSMADLEQIHLGKTGDLLGASCAMGALCGGADAKTTAQFRAFGRQIGLVFQMIDDVVDSLEGTGKSSGKDLSANKLTFLRFMTAEEIRKSAVKKTEDAKALIDDGLGQVRPLFDFASQLCFRER